VVVLTDGRISSDVRNAPVQGEPPNLIDLTGAEPREAEEAIA
jgi:hypothetical protein